MIRRLDDEEIYDLENPQYDPTIDPEGEVSDEDKMLEDEIARSEQAMQPTIQSEPEMESEESPEAGPLMQALKPASEPKSEEPKIPASASPNDLISRREQLLAQYKALKPAEIYDDETLKQAQNDRIDQLRAAAIAEAGAGVAKGIAMGHGADLGDVSKPYEKFREMANIPVSDIKERQSAQDTKRKSLMEEIKGSDEVMKRDPNSRVSQLMKLVAKKRGLDVPEDASAVDLEQLLTKIEKPAQAGKRFQIKPTFNPATGQVELMQFDTVSGEMKPLNQVAGFAQRPLKDPHTEEYGTFNPAMGKMINQITGPKKAVPSSETGEVEFNQSNLTAKQDKDLKSSQKAFLKDIGPDRDAVNAALSVKTMLQAGKEMNGDILRAIQNQLARATGEKGAMTEQDVAPFGGKQAIFDRMKRFASYNSVGEMPDADREFLTKIADVLAKKSNDNIQRRSTFFTKQLYNDWKSDENTKGISSQNIENMLGAESAQMGPTAEPEYVMLKSPNGQIAKVKKDQAEKYIKKGAVIINGR